jgi:hypothetical protein
VVAGLRFAALGINELNFLSPSTNVETFHAPRVGNRNREFANLYAVSVFPVPHQCLNAVNRQVRYQYQQGGAHHDENARDFEAKIQLSEATTKELAKFNPGYQNIYSATAGNASVPIAQALKDIHKANTLNSAETFFDNAATELTGKPSNIDLAAAVRKDPTLMSAILQGEKQMAAGGSTASVLDAVRKSPQGRQLIGVLGARPDRVDQYIQNKANEQKAAAAAATNIATLNVDQKKSDIELDKEKKLAAYKKQIGVTDDGDVVSNTKSYPNEWVDPTSRMHYNLSDSIYNMVEHGQDPRN